MGGQHQGTEHPTSPGAMAVVCLKKRAQIPFTVPRGPGSTVSHEKVPLLFAFFGRDPQLNHPPQILNPTPPP